MSDRIKVAIIGTGGIANSHAKVYKGLTEEVEVVGLCDIVPGRAQRFKDRYDFAEAKIFENYNDLLDAVDFDAASVCAYNTAHSFITVDCLNAGKHVQCEKPMSVTLEESVDMAKAAKKAGKILTIGFQPRYDPNLQTVGEMIQSGLLGQVYYVETGGGRRRGIPGGTFIGKDTAGFGAIADIGCYSLDMTLNALGYPKPLTVTACKSDFFGKSPKYSPGWSPADFQVEDFGTAFIRLEGGITLYFKISWAMHMDTLGPTMFFGTEGGIKVDGGLTVYHDIDGHQTASKIPWKHTTYEIQFSDKIKDYIRAIKENREAPIPGYQIVYNQAIIDGILKSSQTNREVEISIPEI